MIAFIDTEVNPQTKKVADYGAVREDDGEYQPSGAVLHTSSKADFDAFVSGCDAVCGHNIIGHELVLAADVHLVGGQHGLSGLGELQTERGFWSLPVSSLDAFILFTTYSFLFISVWHTINGCRRAHLGGCLGGYKVGRGSCGGGG